MHNFYFLLEEGKYVIVKTDDAMKAMALFKAQYGGVAFSMYDKYCWRTMAHKPGRECIGTIEVKR